jgi:hypothetical protein
MLGFGAIYAFYEIGSIRAEAEKILPEAKMRSCWFLSVVGCVLVAASVSYADTIVPSAVGSIEGNANNGFPFNIGEFGITSQRYQQVYVASEFSGTVTITGIAFRPDASEGAAFSSTLNNVQIDLSTTSAPVDGLSSTFALNVGANVTTVRSGSLPLSSSFTGPAGGPKNFDIVIPFTTPFLYNPALGNLLLDVRNFSGGVTTQFDAQTASDTTSRLFSSPVSATIGNADTLGLVTKFQTTQTTVVPEPGSLLLLATGLAVGLVSRHWSRRLRHRTK